MKLYLLENSIFYDFGCSGMSGMLTKLTNMFVHNYKLPHHQSFPPPSMYMPLPATVSPNHHHHHQYREHQHYHHEHQHHKPPVVRKCAQGWIGGRKGRGKGWGLRRDLSRAPGTFLFFFFWTILIPIYI